MITLVSSTKQQQPKHMQHSVIKYLFNNKCVYSIRYWYIVPMLLVLPTFWHTMLSIYITCEDGLPARPAKWHFDTAPAVEQSLIGRLLGNKVIIHKSRGEHFLWNRNWDLGWFWADYEYLYRAVILCFHGRQKFQIFKNIL